MNYRNLLLPSLILVAAAALLVVTLLDARVMKYVFVHYSYYILILLFFFWITTLVRVYRSVRSPLALTLKEEGPELLFALLITAVVFISVQPYMRILSDEAELMSISQSMTYHKRVDAAYAGVNYGFLFRGLETAIPRRPLLFPFFTHIVHVISGYRVCNAFAVNFLTLFSLLYLISIIFRKTLGKAWAYAAVLFIACQPHVVETATSGGFDLFAVLFLLIAFVALASFLSAPSPEKFDLLWVHLLLLAHIRYESPAIFAIILFFLLIWRLVKKDYFRNIYLYAMTPLMLLPIFWQRLVADPPFNELTEASPFSVSNFVGNNLTFFDHFLVSYGKPPVATFVNALGVAGMILFLFLFLKKQWPEQKANRRLFVTVLASTVFLWVVTTSYYYAKLTAPACTRYFTAFFVLLSVFAVLLLHHSKIFKFRTPALMALSLIFFMLYHPLTYQGGFTNSLDMSRRTRYTLDFLKHYPAKHFLLITDMPAHYTIYNMGAITFEMAAKSEENIKKDFENNLFEEIFVIQDIDVTTGKPTSATTLKADFPLETLGRLLNSDETYIQISRVK